MNHCELDYIVDALSTFGGRTCADQI